MVKKTAMCFQTKVPPEVLRRRGQAYQSSAERSFRFDPERKLRILIDAYRVVIKQVNLNLTHSESEAIL